MGTLSAFGLTNGLPSNDHPQVLSPVVGSFKDAKVSSLINHMSNSWDEDLIKGFLPPRG